MAPMIYARLFSHVKILIQLENEFLYRKETILWIY